MKTKRPTAKKVRGKVAPANEHPANLGGIAMLYFSCPTGIHDDRECGGDVVISIPTTIDQVIGGAQRWASNAGGSVIGITLKKKEETDRVLVFAPCDLTDQAFLSAAANNSSVGSLTMDETIRAHKAVKWIKTNLRGADLCGLIRRAVDVMEPNAVMVWPLGYYFGREDMEAGNRLLEESEFGLPESCRTPSSGWRPNSDDDDTAGEEWKRA